MIPTPAVSGSLPSLCCQPNGEITQHIKRAHHIFFQSLLLWSFSWIRHLFGVIYRCRRLSFRVVDSVHMRKYFEFLVKWTEYCFGQTVSLILDRKLKSKFFPFLQRYDQRPHHYSNANLYIPVPSSGYHVVDCTPWSEKMQIFLSLHFFPFAILTNSKTFATYGFGFLSPPHSIKT